MGDASFFLKKKVGRDALQVQYFKPLDILSLNGRELTLKKLLEPQIENILLDTGREEVLPPGMMTIAEYFETYAPKAVEKRRSLLPAVSRKLIHEFQIKEEHHDASLRSKRLSQFRQHLLDYEATCRMDNIRSYRMNAFSFYLKAAVDYLTSHPVEREIISFLRRNGRVDSGEESTFLGETIRKTQTHIFDLFQSTLAMLVKDPASRPVQEYLAQNPVNGDAPFL